MSVGGVSAGQSTGGSGTCSNVVAVHATGNGVGEILKGPTRWLRTRCCMLSAVCAWLNFVGDAEEYDAVNC